MCDCWEAGFEHLPTDTWTHIWLLTPRFTFQIRSSSRFTVCTLTVLTRQQEGHPRVKGLPCSGLHRLTWCNVWWPMRLHGTCWLNKGRYLFVLFVFNDTFSTNRVYRVIGVWNIYCIGPGGTHRNIDKPKKNTHKHSLPPWVCGGNLLTTFRCPQRGLSSQSLGKYWQLNQSNQHTSTYSRIQQQIKYPYYVTIQNKYA